MRVPIDRGLDLTALAPYRPSSDGSVKSVRKVTAQGSSLFEGLLGNTCPCADRLDER